MRSPLRALTILGAATALASAGAFTLAPPAKADMIVWQCQTYQPANAAPLFVGGNNTGGTVQTFNYCQGGDGLVTEFKSAPYGYGGWWFINVPTGWLTIAEARVWYHAYCPQEGMGGEFVWNDYGQNEQTAGLCGGSYFDQTFSSPVSSFGWRHRCNNSGGCSYIGGTPYPTLSAIQGVWLDVRDGAAPTVAAAGGGPSGKQNLWWHGGGWVRGSGWPVDLVGGDIVGVCQWIAAIDGTSVAHLYTPGDQSQWHQCDQGDTGGTDQYGNHQQRWSASIDTTGISDGWHSYQVGDQNAAGNWTNPTEQIGIDNSPVSLTVTGPTDAPVGDGVQHLTATAAAGPSGVGGIYCSDSGGPSTSEPLSGAGAQTATAQVPVSGLGDHKISCYAVNRAQDANGNPAASGRQTWSLRIGEPVKVGITLSRIRVHCSRVRVRKHHRFEHVLRCHTTTRELRLERVSLGRRATVSGSLETADATPLSHEPVTVLAAPDNGSHHWRKVAVVTTDARGIWQARLPAGPSRLVEAVYPGGPVTEPGTSRQVRVVVPAKMELRVTPSHVRWGGTVVITGRLLGGHIPADRREVSQLLRLRIGVGGIYNTVGIPNVDRHGRFRTTYRFFPGHGVVQYWFAVSTLRETDFPYLPASSARRYVTVG